MKSNDNFKNSVNVKQSYKIWADQYDSNINKTRDLEARSIRETLSEIQFDSCLEIGCGTGKNTEWLITKAKEVMSVDLSDEMISKAKEKISSSKVQFCKADITEDWSFVNKHYDIVIFSLVLEHIENLEEIFLKVSKATRPNSHVYVGELHPFKQYTGTKARFETQEGQTVVTCFNHNISDFTQAAKKHGFEITDIKEYFDNDDRNSIPRILTLLFKRSNK